LTLLVGRQEEHLAGKKLDVDLLVVIRLIFPAVTSTFIILGSNKIQNRDILAPANSDPPGKWP